MTAVNQRHPEPETLSAFADGRLGGDARAAVVGHLDVCDDCTSEVALAMRADGHERGAAQHTISWRRWLPVAAGIALMVLGIVAFRDSLPFARSPIGRLVALAPKTERTVEPRLTGGFAWAEYAGAARTTVESADADRMKLVGAAGDLVARAGRDGDADAQHAAGVAMVLVQNAVEGIPRLEAAARKSEDARVWSDLAAAR
jgi:Putative zinc-finger